MHRHYTALDLVMVRQRLARGADVPDDCATLARALRLGEPIPTHSLRPIDFLPLALRRDMTTGEVRS